MKVSQASYAEMHLFQPMSGLDNATMTSQRNRKLTRIDVGPFCERAEGKAWKLEGGITDRKPSYLLAHRGRLNGEEHVTSMLDWRRSACS